MLYPIHFYRDGLSAIVNFTEKHSGNLYIYSFTWIVLILDLIAVLAVSTFCSFLCHSHTLFKGLPRFIFLLFHFLSSLFKLLSSRCWPLQHRIQSSPFCSQKSLFLQQGLYCCSRVLNFFCLEITI